MGWAKPSLTERRYAPPAELDGPPFNPARAQKRIHDATKNSVDSAAPFARRGGDFHRCAL